MMEVSFAIPFRLNDIAWLEDGINKPLTGFLVQHTVNLNHFRLLRVVGKGAFGKVRIVERKDTSLTFALKYIRKEEGTRISHSIPYRLDYDADGRPQLFVPRAFEIS